jgi:hypothetical protein
MDYAISCRDWIPVHKEMTRKRFLLREELGGEAAKWFMPWDREKGESAPYYHCYVDVCRQGRR